MQSNNLTEPRICQRKKEAKSSRRRALPTCETPVLVGIFAIPADIGVFSEMHDSSVDSPTGLSIGRR